MSESDEPVAPFKHAAVFARFPKGTDPLAAVRESMDAFMERADGSSPLAPWQRVRWWHGGPWGLKAGDVLLAPTYTGVVPPLATTDRDSVYVTSNRSDALLYSLRHDRPALYEVHIDPATTQPDDVIDDSTSVRVPSAIVYRVEVPGKAELVVAMRMMMDG